MSPVLSSADSFRVVVVGSDLSPRRM